MAPLPLPLPLLLAFVVVSRVQGMPELEEWSEETFVMPGAPGGPCRGGVEGICGKPSACTTGEIVHRKCGGGNDNVCCAQKQPGDPGGPCRGGVSGTCGMRNRCSGQLVSGKCSGGWNNVCCTTADGGASSDAACRGAATWAKVLAHPQIDLATVHSSGNVDSANAKQQVTDAAAGKRVQRSSYNDGAQGPGGTTCMDSSVAQFLLQLADELGGVKVNEIAGGTHGHFSAHYAGHAVDIGSVKGQRMTKTNPYLKRTVELCKANGADWTCTADKKLTSCGGHSSWTHCQWNKWSRDMSRAAMRKDGWPAA